MPSVKRPEPQAEQAEAAGPLKDPRGQVAHGVVGWDEKLPASHAVHCEALWALNVPSGQAVHIMVEALEKFPG